MQDQKNHSSVLSSEPLPKMRFKRKRSDLRTNEMRRPEAKKFQHPVVTEDFEEWLNSLKLDDNTENSLRLIHAAAMDDLTKIAELITRISPGRVHGITETFSGYSRYLNSSHFYFACSDAARELLYDSTDMNVTELVDGEGHTPLARCVCNRDLAGVKFWVNKGAVINSETDPLGVLKLAVQDKTIFEYLSFRGNRIRKLSDLYGLEKIARQKGALEVLEIILRERASLETMLGTTLPKPAKESKRQFPEGETTVLIHTRSNSPKTSPEFFGEGARRERDPSTEILKVSEDDDKGLLPGFW